MKLIFQNSLPYRNSKLFKFDNEDKLIIETKPSITAFRVNKYCGELLHIGNEVWESEPSRHPESHEDEEVEEFPKAEARRQSEENVHQITNLKILSKSDTVNKNDSKMVLRKVELDGETSIAKVKMLNFSEKSKPKKENVKLTKNGPKNGVFSQVRVRNRF